MVSMRCKNCNGTLSLSPDGTQMICDYCESVFFDVPGIQIGNVDSGIKTAVFDVVLTGFDPAGKIKVIKAVREITGAGLAEAKDIVEKTPSTIKVGIPETDSQRIKQTLEGNGGIVELKRTTQ